MEKMKKILGFWDSVAIVIGIVIGVGIFRVPAEVAKCIPSGGLIILAWFIGGIFSLLGAASYAELAALLPHTGGDYIYLRESYGKWCAFLYAWSGILIVRTGIIAAVAFIFAEYFASFFSLGDVWVKPAAIALVIALSFINILGLQKGKVLQNVSVLAKLLVLVAIIVLALISKKGNVHNFEALPILSPAGGMDFGKIAPLFALSLIPILWTYGGWHENTFVTGETRDARRTLPLALITGTAVIVLFYIVINTIYIYLVPIDKLAESPLIVSDVMHILCGDWARKIVELLVMLSAFGGLNGTIITSSRITYALANDNPFFGYLGALHEKFKTPARAIILNTSLSVILILWGTFERLLFFTGLLIWLFFAMIAAAVFILRFRYPNTERPFKVWFYPVTPFVFMLVSLLLVVSTAIHYPYQSLAGLIIMLTGLPVYLATRKRTVSQGPS